MTKTTNKINATINNAQKFTIITENGDEGYAKRPYDHAILCCNQIIEKGKASYAAAVDDNGNVVYELTINKENKTMKKTNKDYTLNGTINSTTWQEFRNFMKESGISIGTKSYEQLVEEYNYRNREYCVLWEENHGENYKGVSAKFETEKEALDMVDKLNKENINDIYHDINAYHIVDGKYIEIFRKEEKSTTVSVGDMSEDTYVGEINPAPSKSKFVIDRKHGDYIVKNIVKASFVASKGDSKGKRVITMHKLFGIIRKAYTNNLNDKLEEMFIKDVINQLVKLQYIGFKKYESGAIVFYPTIKAAKYSR
jgi:hypothetical protein